MTKSLNNIGFFKGVLMRIAAIFGAVEKELWKPFK